MRILLPLLAVWLGAATPLAAIPIGRGVLPWWQRRFDAKAAALAERKPELVFYGDSIMQYLESGPRDQFDYQPVWRHYYGGRDAINLGFKGDPTSALIWRLRHGEADHMAPKLAIVMIGANNFGHLHWSPADTLVGIGETIRLIEHKLPNTHILLLGVLPSQRSAWITAATDTTNRALAARYGDGQDPSVTYRDVTRLFMHDGRLDTGLFIDPHLTHPDPPLHPTPEGWQLIAQAIEPVVAQYMGDAPRPPMAAQGVFGK